MEHILFRSSLRRAASRTLQTSSSKQCLDRRRDGPVNSLSKTIIAARRCRNYATNPPRAKDNPPDQSDVVQESSYAQPSHRFSQSVSPEETSHYSRVIEHSREQQIRSPWTRADSDVPPVARQRSAGAMVKGKLLTTPSRMLKLILPLTPKDTNKDRKDIEPLALLVHPQQPLSYLERLIQAELPTIRDENDREKIPSIIFRAEDVADTDSEPGRLSQREDDEAAAEAASSDMDNSTADKEVIDGKVERTGKISSSSGPGSPSRSSASRHDNFVRWSPSTEIGDFIRDASRSGQEFSVEIEGAPEPVYVGVPSFEDRTFYLRMRLRKIARKISAMADMKAECDRLAHKGAQRVAQAGFAGLIGWWYLVYRLTFETELGWDVMEPVTYLVGLSTLIAGYMWFLYHNREVSYRSAMNFTISRRQNQLYEQRGLDLPTWEGLVEEGNRLRREIKLVAEEYDVEWDEKKEEGDEKVTEALRNERKKAKGQGEDEGEEEEDGDGKKKKKEKAKKPS